MICARLPKQPKRGAKPPGDRTRYQKKSRKKVQKKAGKKDEQGLGRSTVWHVTPEQKE